MSTLKKIKEKKISVLFRIVYQKIKPRLIPGYRKALVFETKLKNKYPENNLESGIEISVIQDLNELIEFASKRGDWYLDYARETFNNGNYCFVAKVKGKIVSCLWTSFNLVNMNIIQYYLKVDKDVVPLVDAYTLDEYRKMGLHRLIWNYCINFLIEQNIYDRVQVHILHKNKRSLMTHSNLAPDSKIVMKIILIKGFGLRFHIVKKLY